MKNFNFGENLRMLRIYKNVCQEGMAASLNISQASYSRIEASQNIPEITVINKLSDTLEVRPKDLLSANWYARALDGNKAKNKTTVATINQTGKIAYGVLLTIAALDFMRAAIADPETESIDLMIFIGLCLSISAIFLYQYTVKDVRIVEVEE